MSRWRLTGNYGTFEIERVVTADDEDQARESTGIMVDLEDVGWTFSSSPDGEEWEIVEVCGRCDGDRDPDWYCSENYCPECCVATDEGGEP